MRIIPNYAEGDAPLCGHRSLDASNAFHKNSLSNSSTPAHCLLLGAGRGASVAKSPGRADSLVWVGIKKKKKKTRLQEVEQPQRHVLDATWTCQEVSTPDIPRGCPSGGGEGGGRFSKGIRLLRGLKGQTEFRQWVGGHSGWRVWNKYYPGRWEELSWIQSPFYFSNIKRKALCSTRNLTKKTLDSAGPGLCLPSEVQPWSRRNECPLHSF